MKIPPADTVDPGVFGGIVIGITSALLWQRYHRTKLPAALAFFSGRRLVPMLTAVAGIAWAILFGNLWPPIGDALDSMAIWMYDNGEVGAGLPTASSTACSSRSACTTSSTRSCGSRPRSARRPPADGGRPELLLQRD